MEKDNVQISENATAMEILKAIDAWAEARDGRREQEALWFILSGTVRGPDDDNYDVKTAYTVPLRSAVLPNLATKAGADARHNVTYEALVKCARYCSVSGKWSHFNNHIRLAAESILQGDGPDQPRY